MQRLFFLADTSKATIGTVLSLFMTAKPIDMADELELIGKGLWITASLLAIAWWLYRFYKEFKK